MAHRPRKSHVIVVGYLSAGGVELLEETLVEVMAAVDKEGV